MLHVSCYFKSEPKYFAFYNHIIECQSNTLMNLHALEKISFIDARNLETFHVTSFCEWFVLRNKIKISSKPNPILKTSFRGITNDTPSNVPLCANKNEH